MTTVLGIDIGTQSVKVVFYDFEARQIASISSAPLDLYQTDDGVAEQRAEWWIEALQKGHGKRRKKRARESRRYWCFGSAAWLCSDRQIGRSTNTSEALVRYVHRRRMRSHHRGIWRSRRLHRRSRQSHFAGLYGIESSLVSGRSPGPICQDGYDAPAARLPELLSDWRALHGGRRCVGYRVSRNSHSRLVRENAAGDRSGQRPARMPA